MKDYRAETAYLLKFKDQFFQLQEEVESLALTLSGKDAEAPSPLGEDQAGGPEAADEEKSLNRRESELLRSFQKIVCGAVPSKKLRHTLREAAALFDPDWYTRQSRKRFFRMGHYLRVGYKFGWSPHPLFDPDYYIGHNRLYGMSGNPLMHFVSVGGTVGLSPHELFDARWYSAQYEDVAKSLMNPLVHYLKFGFSEGRDPSPGFSTEFYLQAYPDVKQANMNPLLHYVLYGKAEGRATHE